MINVACFQQEDRIELQTDIQKFLNAAGLEGEVFIESMTQSEVYLPENKVSRITVTILYYIK